MESEAHEITSRTQRAFRQFHTAVENLVQDVAPDSLRDLADTLLSCVTSAVLGTDYWEQLRGMCEGLSIIPYCYGTLTEAIEWETLKLQARLGYGPTRKRPPPLFCQRHVHIATLIKMWQKLTLQTEAVLAKQGHDTLLDVGPWGGFNFVVKGDGYTRMPFARLTLAVGSLPNTPLEEDGGPFFEDFLPRYLTTLQSAGVTIPNEFKYQYPKRHPSGRLEELSCTYHFPHHTYDRRTFVKIRFSRAYETVEEITLHDLLGLLERLHFTTDWDAYREQTQDVDIRFDLQDFISLSHIVEGIYQRTPTEEALLLEIKEAFRGAIKERKLLYQYVDDIRKSKWIENLYWAVAQRALGIRKYQRPVSFSKEICPNMPPRLLIPVRRHLQSYHHAIGKTPLDITEHDHG